MAKLLGVFQIETQGEHGVRWLLGAVGALGHALDPVCCCDLGLRVLAFVCCAGTCLLFLLPGRQFDRKSKSQINVTNSLMDALFTRLLLLLFLAAPEKCLHRFLIKHANLVTMSVVAIKGPR